MEKGGREIFVGFLVVSACHRPSLVAVALAGGREMPCLALAVTTGLCVFVVCLSLCRVLYLGHTVKRHFAVCPNCSTRKIYSTRQSGYLPCAP